MRKTALILCLVSVSMAVQLGQAQHVGRVCSTMDEFDFGKALTAAPQSGTLKHSYTASCTGIDVNTAVPPVTLTPQSYGAVIYGTWTGNCAAVVLTSGGTAGGMVGLVAILLSTDRVGITVKVFNPPSLCAARYYRGIGLTVDNA
jgi:hypothetical protein